MAELSREDERADRSAFTLRVFRYLENGLSGDECDQLQQELMADPARQDLFVELCITRQGMVQLFRSRAQFNREMDCQSTPSTATITAAFTEKPRARKTQREQSPREQSQSEQSQGAGPAMRISRPAAPPWWQKPTARAAAILLPLIGLPIIWYLMRGGPSHTSPSFQTQSQIATVSLGLNPGWDGSGNLFPVGSSMGTGSYALDRGQVQIRLAGGAEVLVESPAQFEILSSNRVSLTNGQLSAMVPHGSAGLTVQTPDMEAVDLGTEFGVTVVPHVQTHMEVFQGQVRAAIPGKPNAPVVESIFTANHGVVVKSGSNVIETDDPTPLAYLRAKELHDRSARGGDDGFARWRAFSEVVRQDPDLLDYYTFDNQTESPQRLLNRSDLTQGSHDAELGVPGLADSAPEWSAGRWAGKPSLLFGGRANSVVRIPNDADLISPSSFSYVMWIKRLEMRKPVHLLSATSGSVRCLNLTLIGTEGETKPLRDSNSIYFDLGPTKGAKQSRLQAAPHVLPSESKWFLLGLTMGPDSVMHAYINGQQVAKFPMQIPNLSRTGDLWLGQPDPSARDLGQKQIFRGWIDEFSIFRRVLSDREMQRMYECGQPG